MARQLRSILRFVLGVCGAGWLPQETTTMSAERWDSATVAERWSAFTPDEREALMRYGWKQAPWEDVPDTAHRLLKADTKVTLDGARKITAVFRAAYNELAGWPQGTRMSATDD